MRVRPPGYASHVDLEAVIREHVERRGAGRTVCPSEVARAVGGDGDERWRPLMPAVREAAAAMARRGEIAVTQRGEPVDALDARGPIRLGLPAGD
ncbi:DUF3253 domain-containing protein [Conexibacter sp. SYSU D00693]|uniref:DUF3253 domain-containing protein n=1 Tax=Conexibacter sp. SYSU D00693 TaxID=2812560 RepID=UPI001F11F1BA|nr:DUF3253 domain-containing protein [Conexibacter sp. SYSU D00693]